MRSILVRGEKEGRGIGERKGIFNNKTSLNSFLPLLLLI